MSSSIHTLMDPSILGLGVYWQQMCVLTWLIVAQVCTSYELNNQSINQSIN